MKKLLFIGFYVLFCGPGWTQTALDTIVENARAYYEQGKFEMSLIEYKKALDLEPKNQRVHYEIAMSYYELSRSDEAMKHAKLGNREKSDTGVDCAILLGTLQDEKGEHKKALKTYRKGIADYGDYYLLWYNLGVTANKLKDYALAEEAFAKAVKGKMDYSLAHYALSGTKLRSGHIAEALLPIYFFLLLEASSDLSKRACSDINRLWSIAAKPDSDTGTINLNAFKLREADQEMALIAFGSDIFGETNTSREAQLALMSKKLFAAMGHANTEGRDDLWTSYYIPFFSRIANSAHFETFMHYIYQSSDAESALWVDENVEKLEEFFDWLDEVETTKD